MSSAVADSAAPASADGAPGHLEPEAAVAQLQTAFEALHLRLTQHRRSSSSDDRHEAPSRPRKAAAAPAANGNCAAAAPVYNHLVVIDEGLEEDWDFQLTEEEARAFDRALRIPAEAALAEDQPPKHQPEAAEAQDELKLESSPNQSAPASSRGLTIVTGELAEDAADPRDIAAEAALPPNCGPPSQAQRQAVRLLHRLLVRYDELSDNQVLGSLALPVSAQTPRSRGHGSGVALSRQASRSSNSGNPYCAGNEAVVSPMSRLVHSYSRLSNQSLNRPPSTANRVEARRQIERHYASSSVFGRALSLSVLPLLPKLFRMLRQLALPLDWSPPVPSELQEAEKSRRNLDEFNLRYTGGLPLKQARSLPLDDDNPQAAAPAPGQPCSQEAAAVSDDEDGEPDAEPRARRREILERAELVTQILQILSIVCIGAPEATRPVLVRSEILPELVELLRHPNWQVVEQLVLTLGKIAACVREELIKAGVLTAMQSLHRRIQRAQHLSQLREHRRKQKLQLRSEVAAGSVVPDEQDGDHHLAESSDEDCGCDLSGSDSEDEDADHHHHHLHHHQPHHHHRHHSSFCVAEDEMPTSMRKSLFWALSSVVRDQPFASAEVGRRVLQRLVIPEFMVSAGVDYELHLLWALRYLSEHDILGCELAACTKVVRRLLRIISKAGRPLVIPALQILAELGSGDEESMQKLLDAGLLDGLLNLFRRPGFDDDRLRWKICWIVSSVATGDDRQCKALVQHPLLPQIARLLNSGGNASVHRELFSIFHNLLDSEDRNSRMAFMSTEGPLFSQLIIFVRQQLDIAYREHEYPALVIQAVELLAQAVEQLYQSGNFKLTPDFEEMVTVLERASKDRDLSSDTLDDIDTIVGVARSAREARNLAPPAAGARKISEFEDEGDYE